MNERPYKYDFYLAHPFDSRHRLKEWGEWVEKEYGVSILNPFYDAERNDILRVDTGKQERYQSDPVQLVERDLHFIQSCDAVIANVTGELSYGTIQEIVYARLFIRPVYLIVTNGHEKHPWLMYHAMKVFTSYKEFELWLRDSKYGRRDDIRDGSFPELAGQVMTREERIKHIKDHPDEHKHTSCELIACCMVDGALDLSMMDVHGEYFDLGTNGGTNCDVVDGPCACGAWHHRKEKV